MNNVCNICNICNVCNICKENNDESSIFLKCKHQYHYECILSSLKYSSNECPYCRQSIFISDIIKISSKTCPAIIQSGKNKGKPCLAIIKNNNIFCGKHLKLNN